jgi:hypothetical protein
LTASIPASDIAGAGTVQVSAFNPAPGGGTSNSLVFMVNAANSVLEINSWEDTHQSPVLQTTTSSSALNQTDGAWTEFLHTASRPYPAVFAAVNEENFGLPVMRFYSGNIPNGEYEVIAKLYTQISGRNMRYYYGYTADTPKAFSVDTVGGTGGAEQFTEYSLGTTNITSGTFNIYVRDADLLPGSGSYPFFGWAKIRLVPVF